MTPATRAPAPAPSTGASPGRRLALQVVRRVFEGGAYADRAFRSEAGRARLDPRERAFAERLCFGTVQRRMTLDHVLGRCVDRPLDAVDAPLLAALRLGVYQLLFLDSVPDRAAVAETVELAKAEAGPRAGGFANAVMRRAARDGRAALTRLDDRTPEGAAVLHSHPRWLVDLWWEALGAEATRALLARDNAPPETALRVNTLRGGRDEALAALAAEGVAAHAVPALPEAVVLDGAADLARLDVFRDGLVTPQSRASMLVARVVDPQPGERVLDLCAAPGAKTTHLAALMQGAGEIAAVERHPGRARALEENCDRLGAAQVRVHAGDARDPDIGTGFDRVLLDPPCSDLGTLQARPDVRWRKHAGPLEELAALQAELLGSAAQRVRPGGTLVYSTCTISAAEGAEQVRRFLDGHPQFAADDLGSEHPGLADAADPRFLQTLPHRDHTDGFFVARLRRAADAPPERPQSTG